MKKLLREKVWPCSVMQLAIHNQTSHGLSKETVVLYLHPSLYIVPTWAVKMMEKCTYVQLIIVLDLTKPTPQLLCFVSIQWITRVQECAHVIPLCFTFRYITISPPLATVTYLDLCYIFQLHPTWHYDSVPLWLTRVMMQHFTVMRLVILFPVLSGLEEVQGMTRLSRAIARLCSRPLIAMNQDSINASLTTVLATTPRIAQLMSNVS